MRSQAETADSLLESLQYETQKYLSDLTAQQTAQMTALQHSWEMLAYQTSHLVGDLQNLGEGAKSLQGVLEQSRDIAISTKVSQELAATWLQAGVEQAQRISTGLNETEGRMGVVLASLEARQQQLDRSRRWSPSLFASPALISLGQGKSDFAAISCRGLLIVLDICWQVICYMVSRRIRLSNSKQGVGIRYGLPSRYIASWNQKALCARVRSGDWGPASR